MNGTDTTNIEPLQVVTSAEYCEAYSNSAAKAQSESYRFMACDVGAWHFETFGDLAPGWYRIEAVQG